MDEQELSFEQSMQRLEQIVRQLEKGDAPLEDAMKLFTEGTSLAARCQFMLEQAEKYPCDNVVTYCNRCTSGVRMAGKNGIHLMELVMGTYRG